MSVVIASLISCNRSQNAGSQSAAQEEKTLMVTEQSGEGNIVVPRGKEIYDEYCLACHQADGSGVPGMYPPLAQAEYVTGPTDRLIKVIVFGLEGPIVVLGESYSQEMPAHDFISDEDIAILVNYLIETWGNKGSPVSADDVKRVRASGNN